MDKVLINIADDFSDAPGARNRSDGDDSGQEFFEDILCPKYKEAISKNKVLSVNLDGTYGYATSFISESFGSLSKQFGAKSVLDNIEIISEEDEKIKLFTLKTIKDPSEK